MLSAVSLVAVVCLATAGLARNRVSPGISTGLFIAGLTTLLVVNYGLGAPTVEQPNLMRSAAIATAFALLWFVAGLWIDRGVEQGAGSIALERRAARRLVSRFAAASGALIAVALLMIEFDRGEGFAEAGLSLLLVGLLTVAAGGLYLATPSKVGGYALLAVPLVGVQFSVHGSPLAEWLATWRSLAMLLSGACLLAVLGAVWWRWRQRISMWHAAPERLVERPQWPPLLHAAVLTGGVIIGFWLLLTPPDLWLVGTTVVGSIAVLIVGQLYCCDRAGTLGLALLGGAVIAASAWWSDGQLSGLQLGWVLAAGYLLWLARFWHQQLCDGRPWTTAGRMIPAARALGHGAVGGAFVYGIVIMLGGSGGSTAVDVARCLLGCGLAAMLIGDVRQGGAAAAFCAQLAVVAAVSGAHPALGTFGFDLPWSFLLAGGGALLALRAAGSQMSREAQWTLDAGLGGILPAGVVSAMLMNESWRDQPVTVVVALACVVLTLLLRLLPQRQPATAVVA